MQTVLKVAIATMIVGATLDGVSTAWFVTQGFHEVNPLMIWIFGSSAPTYFDVFFKGGIVVMAEAGLAFLIGWRRPEWQTFISGMLASQAIVQLFCAIT